MTPTPTRNWLMELKVGDYVAYPVGFADGLTTEKVSRVTATLIFVGNTKYRRSDGRQVGASVWDRTGLIELTEEVKEAIFRQRVIAKLQRLSWKDVETAILRDIVKLLPSAAKEPKR